MDIKPNTLVLVVGQQYLLKKPTWGIVRAQCGVDSYHVSIPKIEIHKGVFQDFVVAKEAELLVVLETDGTITNPEKAIRHYMPEVMAGVIRDSRPENAEAVVDFQTGDLIVVLSENFQEARWGIVKKIMPAGGLMVIIGDRWFKPSRNTTLVPLKKAVYVVSTDGKIKSPRKAFFKNLPEISAIIMLQALQKAQTRT